MAVIEPARTALGATHEVSNQSVPLAGYNVFEQDRPLVEALEREGAEWAYERARVVGEIAGGEALEWGRQANENPPVLRTHDRFGNRIDEVEFHPSWHRLLDVAVAHGTHSLAWTEDRPGAHVARAAIFMAMGQAEGGHGCPISMTYSAVPALRATPELAQDWEPLLTSTTYDPRLVPAADKAGALFGMAMTEKQGGSDVRANTTTARPLNGGGPGGEYEIVGHKWFCSAPMCDAFLVLAQAPVGPLLLPASKGASRRHAQPLPSPAAEGQARQPVERLQRGRVPRRAGPHARRGRSWRADHHRDGQPHPARLRAGLDRGHAPGRGSGNASRRAPLRLRQAPDRPAADAERAGRPLRRIGGCHDHRRCGWRARTTSPTRTSARPSSAAWRRRSRSTGSASAGPHTRTSRSSASAATATSRSPGCRGCSGSRR